MEPQQRQQQEEKKETGFFSDPKGYIIAFFKGISYETYKEEQKKELELAKKLKQITGNVKSARELEIEKEINESCYNKQQIKLEKEIVYPSTKVNP